MIEREITPRLKALFEQYPFVTVTGPRQSGKTTLCRSAFPDLAYANLEALDQRNFAETDPRGFLAQLGEGAIIDEIQRVPDLLSYLQVIADERRQNGMYVLTGSEQFQLSDAISQSLAGRTALLRLLPLSLSELQQMETRPNIDRMLYSGFYPRIFDQRLEPSDALADYFETYVERDVRRLGGVRNLSTFQRFAQLCAGRVGQLLNLSSLGSDIGISHTTAREWLTILEASYIVYLLPPFHANIGKRLTKSPKLYFYDVGLASYLIGIERAEQLSTHPLRGFLFENLVVSEAMKYRFNRGRRPNLSFFRDSKGLECDLLYETSLGTGAIEIKSGATVSTDFFTSLNRVAELVPNVSSKAVVYGGTARQSRSDCEVVPIEEFTGVLERFEVEQEVAAFVAERETPGPAWMAMDALDDVYRSQIRPALDAMEEAIEPLGYSLFRDQETLSLAQAGGYAIEGTDILVANRWRSIKDEQFLNEAIALKDVAPIEEIVISHEWKLCGYTGRGKPDFDVTLTVTWKLLNDHMSREISIDGTTLSLANLVVSYPDLEGHSAAIDHLVAASLKGLMSRIAAKSDA